MKQIINQHIENLPAEILALPRFFKAGTQWQEPENLKVYSEIDGEAEFLAATEQKGGLILIRFVDCLTDSGDFVNFTARKLFKDFCPRDTYCERTADKRGLQFFIKPPANLKKPIITDRDNKPISNLRYSLNSGKSYIDCFFEVNEPCTITGDVFNCKANAPLMDEISARYVFEGLTKIIATQNKPIVYKPTVKPVTKQENTIEQTPRKKITNPIETEPPPERRQVTKSTRHHEPKPAALPKQDREPSANTSDYANAKRLANLFGDRLRYLQDADKWLTYDGGIWTKAANSRNGAIMPFITRAAEILKADARTPADRKIAACFENTRKAAPAITFLKGIDSIIVKQADLDNHPFLLNCLNGVVNLQDGKLYPADPSLLLTRQAAAEFKGIDYRDSDNLAEKFLRDIMPDDDTREALLRFLGYSLSGVIREQVAQFWRGDGANGKSTLINLLMEVLNTYATKIPNAAILISNKPADADRATTALNSLDGARLAIFDELPQNARLNTALFKTLAGGDKIAIRRLHEEGVVIKPTAKIILSGNFNPQLDNTGDFGCSRKIRNLPFGETFTGERADDRLLEKLLTADARAALLALLVDAARRWYRDGLIESAQMKAAKTDYLAENDFLEEFISENCEFGDGFIELKIFVRKLRDAYEDETRTISDRNLKDMLKRRLDGKDGVKYGLHHKTRRAGFHGIRWNDNAAYDFGGTPINPQDVPDFSR